MILMTASSTSLNFPDTIVLDLDDSISDYFAFAFQKNSEFAEIFDAFLLKLRQAGIMNKIHQKWIPSTGKEGKGDSQEAVTLGFENMSFPFLSLAFGALVAVALEVGARVLGCCMI